MHAHQMGAPSFDCAWTIEGCRSQGSLGGSARTGEICGRWKSGSNHRRGSNGMRITLRNPPRLQVFRRSGLGSDLQDALSSSSPKQEEIIRWVESGGNVSWTCAAGMTLLHYAAMTVNERMVRFLLEHGANVNAVAEFNMTPLLWACRDISTSVIPTLLDHAADPRAKTEDGYTALQFLRQSGLEEAKRRVDSNRHSAVTGF